MSKTYTISKETIDLVLEVLSNYSIDGDRNNDDVMEAESKLYCEIKDQNAEVIDVE